MLMNSADYKESLCWTGALPADLRVDVIEGYQGARPASGARGRQNLVQQDNGQVGNYGYRAGNWKLVRHDSKSGRNLVVEKELANTKVPEFQLFDLAKDALFVFR